MNINQKYGKTALVAGASEGIGVKNPTVLPKIKSFGLKIKTSINQDVLRDVYVFGRLTCGSNFY